MVTTKLNLSMTEPQVRQIYAKQGDTGRVLDITLDQTPEDGTLRILRPDGVEVTSEAVTGGEVESGSSFDSLTEADVTELSVGIEPVQDLNGYDKPWVGGAGKNLFNIDRTEGTLSGRDPSNARSFDFGKFYVGLSANNYYSAATVNSYSLVNNGVKVNAANRPYGIAFPMAVTVGTNYYVSYTQAPNQEYRVGFFDADGNYLGDSGGRTQPSYFTPPTSTATAVIVFTCTSSGENTDVTYANIQVEIGTSGSTWQPYSNICPITGHDEVRVTRTGKNLCPTFTGGTESGLTYTVNEDGSVHVTGTCTRTTFWAVQLTLPKGTYVLTGAPTNGQLTLRSARGGGAPSSAFSGVFDDYGNGATFTVSETASAWLNIRLTAGTHDKTYYPMIRLASETDDSYEPYQGSTYTTSLGQTVYGGTLDMVSGVLTVTHGNIASYNGETLPSTWISDRDVYASGTTPTTGAQVVYELATPLTYTLTAQQIQTLLGTNNVWASSGQIVNIKFTYGGLLSELPSEATEIVGKCYCDVEQNGVSSMPFTLNVKKNERAT